MVKWNTEISGNIKVRLENENKIILVKCKEIRAIIESQLKYVEQDFDKTINLIELRGCLAGLQAIVLKKKHKVLELYFSIDSFGAHRPEADLKCKEIYDELMKILKCK